MRLEEHAGDTAFRVLIGAGFGISVGRLVYGYVRAGELDWFFAVGQLLVVVVFATLLVTYWNHMERRAAAE